MPDTVLPSTLREMRGHFARPATWIVLGGVALVLTVLAPFDTDTLLRPLPRAAFWLTHSAASYGIGFLIVPALMGLFAGRMSHWPAITLAGAIAGVAISLGVLVINSATLGYIPRAVDTPPLVGTVVIIAVVVTLVIEVINREVTPAVDTVEAGPPPLLDRLPLEKRGHLVSLSVEDHYVRIRTDQGEALVLLRLSDALREVGGTPGLQVHRSHWVALDQVTGARREGDRAILSLTHGPEVPVSRANIPAIREAGLLPRT